MAGKGNFLSNGVLNNVFNAATLAGIFENASSSPITEIWCSLHSADPGPAGDQTTNEVAYSGYARVSVDRNTGGWPTTTDQSISPAANISWPTSTGGTDVIAYVAFGTASSGAGEILYSGPVSPNVTASTGVEPILSSASTITES